MKKAVGKWLLKAAAKEQNPYVQAEILYSVLKEMKALEKAVAELKRQIEELKAKV